MTLSVHFSLRMEENPRVIYSEANGPATGDGATSRKRLRTQ